MCLEEKYYCILLAYTTSSVVMFANAIPLYQYTSVEGLACKASLPSVDLAGWHAGTAPVAFLLSRARTRAPSLAR